MAVRDSTNRFAATPMLTVPLPDAAFGANVTQLALPDTDQAQLSPLAMTPIAPLPAPVPNGLPSAAVSSVTLQAAAPCEIVSVLPPTTI